VLLAATARSSRGTRRARRARRATRIARCWPRHGRGPRRKEPVEKRLPGGQPAALSAGRHCRASYRRRAADCNRIRRKRRSPRRAGDVTRVPYSGGRLTGVIQGDRFPGASKRSGLLAGGCGYAASLPELGRNGPAWSAFCRSRRVPGARHDRADVARSLGGRRAGPCRPVAPAQRPPPPLRRARRAGRSPPSRRAVRVLPSCGWASAMLRRPWPACVPPRAATSAR
jgi:hypothetical protein